MKAGFVQGFAPISIVYQIDICEGNADADARLAAQAVAGAKQKKCKCTMRPLKEVERIGRLEMRLEVLRMRANVGVPTGGQQPWGPANTQGSKKNAKHSTLQAHYEPHSAHPKMCQ